MGLTKRAHRSYSVLLQQARHAYRHAYAPHSRFRVGAALLAASGKVYTGCNVESTSYGLTICAERTAVFKAVSEGERTFKAIAIASEGGGATPPCGACRQVLWDLAGNIDIIITNERGGIEARPLKDLLPRAFGLKNLRAARKR